MGSKLSFWTTGRSRFETSQSAGLQTGNQESTEARQSQENHSIWSKIMQENINNYHRKEKSKTLDSSFEYWTQSL